MKTILCALCLLIFGGCSPEPGRELVIYTSQDQFYAEPILAEFTRATGIAVRPVFDTESAKTAGLANRLRQEAGHPRCDVFWSNEEMHARLLAAEGVFRSDEIRTVGYRARQLVVNTNLLPASRAPRELLELTNAVWKGKIALAYPLYGTTSSHFVALRQLWGPDLWRRWCEGLAANEAKLVDGNSVVVKLVGAGEAWIGLTDSDDVAAGKQAGLPLETVALGREMLIIPNTISLPRGPNRAEAHLFVEFLSRPETLQRLVDVHALAGLEFPRDGLAIDWHAAASDFPAASKVLKGIFLRS